MRLKLADYFTYGNLISGLLSIYFSINNSFTLAAISILVGVFFDYIDGKVARMRKEESELGAQLDSFADAITFGVSIAVLLHIRFQSTYLDIVLLFFVCAGIYRLARFNMKKDSKPTKYFEGTPITINGIVFPLVIIFYPNIYLIEVLLIVLSATMVSKLKIKHW
ncbi:CDP-diacylglycerol--serine O-phosphatidyltransferase [Candidatus Woesearchaeota archaeon]|nr:MAG: CDP-diacylglycerol--serine O-phosphatidyltransferase [Candidatus Woesearchaeota archaeon]